VFVLLILISGCRANIIKNIGHKADYKIKAILPFCSLTTASLLTYNAYFVTTTSELFGRNFSLAYSYGFIAFNTLAVSAYVKTDLFSLSDFYMRNLSSRFITSYLDSFALVTLLEGNPNAVWDDFSKSVFSFFIISILFSTNYLWVSTLEQSDENMIFTFNEKLAKENRFSTLFLGIIFIDIPFIVLRVVGYFYYQKSVSSFIVKNLITIAIAFKEYLQIRKDIN